MGAALVIGNETPGVSPKIPGWRDMEKGDKCVQAQARGPRLAPNWASPTPLGLQGPAQQPPPPLRSSGTLVGTIDLATDPACYCQVTSPVC